VSTALDFLWLFWAMVYTFFFIGMFMLQRREALIRYRGRNIEDVDIFYDFVLIPLVSAIIWPVMILVKAAVLAARRSIDKDSSDEV
jgi:uncharacterized membrane protein YhaH (DUF805 family)